LAFIGDLAIICTFDKKNPAFNRDPAFVGDLAFIRSFTELKECQKFINDRQIGCSVKHSAHIELGSNGSLCILNFEGELIGSV